MGFDLRRARGQPVRRGRQRGDHQRRTQREVRPLRAVLSRRRPVTRADDNSVKSLDDIKGKVAGETATSNWAQVARDHGARVEAVEGFTQAIKLLNQGRVDLVINDSIAVYAYLAETGDTSVKIATTTGEKSEQGFAARKNSGLLPDLNRPWTNCAPTANWPTSRRSTSRQTRLAAPRRARRNMRRGRRGS